MYSSIYYVVFVFKLSKVLIIFVTVIYLRSLSL